MRQTLGDLNVHHTLRHSGLYDHHRLSSNAQHMMLNLIRSHGHGGPEGNTHGSSEGI